MMLSSTSKRIDCIGTLMTAPKESEALKNLVIEALEDVKGLQVVALDVEEQTDITDFMIVATGKSGRQVKALTDSVIINAKAAGYVVKGVEGSDTAEWVLIDLGDVICHVMLPKLREFYGLERLWSINFKVGGDVLAED